MEEDRNLQAAGALVAIVGLVILVVQFAGRRPAPKPSSGPGWYSRINPFGSEPSGRPAPAPEPASPELAPPERVMTNAATRLFSSPTSAGSSGGLAGAEPPAPAPEAANAPLNAPRLASASMNFPDSGHSPVSGGSAPGFPPPGAGPRPPPAAAPSGAAPGRASAAGAGAGGGGRRGGGGGAPGGDTAAAASGAAAFSGAAGAGITGNTSPGAPRLNPAGAGGASMPKTETLNEPASVTSSGSSGGGGGPGGGGGGGSGGSGGSGGMGGAVPGGKPKASAGKPAGVDASAGGAGGAGGAGAGGGRLAGAGGSFGPNGAGEGEGPGGPAAMTGTPEVGDGVPSGSKFSLTPGGPAIIETATFLTKNKVPIVGFTAKMAIDGDGPGGGHDGDATYQKETALKSNGVSLDARKVPFIVIPGDFSKAHKDVGLGDFAAVTYGGKTYYAIVGDVGPRGVLGEGSPALAQAVGIDPNPKSGGIQSASVRYWIIPKTAKRPAPTAAAEIQSLVGAEFQRAGAALK